MLVADSPTNPVAFQSNYLAAGHNITGALPRNGGLFGAMMKILAKMHLTGWLGLP
jgi:hypothetical protein